MHLGIIGPAQSGKSTLFGAATGSSLELGHGAHRAIVKVPDSRLDTLAEMEKPKKVTPAEVEYLDWGGVSVDPANASEMESKIPAEIRASDALVVVIRAFESDVVAHPRGSVDPQRDLDDLQLALVLADLSTVERRLTKLERTLKVKKDTNLDAERVVLVLCREQLEAEKPIREMELKAEQWKKLRGFELISAKPLLIVVNASESDDISALETLWQSRVPQTKCKAIALSAQIEMEIAQLEQDEQQAFMADLGIKEPALARMIRASYELMGRISYFTAGEPEVRAWTIPIGATAVEAADVIHSDIARGFIRAEVVAYDHYVNLKGIPGAKQAGKFRLEGKEYVVSDGDVIYFRFNV